MNPFFLLAAEDRAAMKTCSLEQHVDLAFLRRWYPNDPRLKPAVPTQLERRIAISRMYGGIPLNWVRLDK